MLDFLGFAQKIGKDVVMVTNAHSKTLEIKLARTPIGPYFDRIIPAEEVGEAKEQPIFWEKLEKTLNFSKDRTILVDDNATVLAAAKSYGLTNLIYVAKPSSRRPVQFSQEFPSIVYFKELIF